LTLRICQWDSDSEALWYSITWFPHAPQLSSSWKDTHWPLHFCNAPAHWQLPETHEDPYGHYGDPVSWSYKEYKRTYNIAACSTVLIVSSKMYASPITELKIAIVTLARTRAASCSSRTLSIVSFEDK
jgi:hypothetical protein